VEIFRADLHQAVAANPFITFFTVATDSGTLEFRWTDDNGQVEMVSAKITME
jgi:sulfur-oxidizing protein SoxZ